MEKELDGVQNKIAAQKADDQRRERRRREAATAAREEQDAEMRRWGEDGEEEDSAGEVGVSIEERKRRKVVRKRSFCMGTASVGDLDVDGAYRGAPQFAGSRQGQVPARIGKGLYSE